MMPIPNCHRQLIEIDHYSAWLIALSEGDQPDHFFYSNFFWLLKLSRAFDSEQIAFTGLGRPSGESFTKKGELAPRQTQRASAQRAKVANFATQPLGVRASLPGVGTNRTSVLLRVEASRYLLQSRVRGHRCRRCPAPI